jgi:choline dehydrogenase-like flavoprotein
MNWFYKTAINFCGWTVGPRDDYDEWARLAGHDRFSWKNVRRVLKRVTNLDPQIPDQRLKHIVTARPEDHSTRGNVRLTYGEEWLPDVGDIFTAAHQVGHRINQDVNDGDPIGMGMSCSTGSERSVWRRSMGKSSWPVKKSFSQAGP